MLAAAPASLELLDLSDNAVVASDVRRRARARAGLARIDGCARAQVPHFDMFLRRCTALQVARARSDLRLIFRISIRSE